MSAFLRLSEILTFKIKVLIFKQNIQHAKEEISAILAGERDLQQGTLLQTAACISAASQRTSEAGKIPQFFNRQERKQYNRGRIKPLEEAALLTWAKENRLWVSEADFLFTYLPNYIEEGSEQKVYLNGDGKTVIKRNTGCYHSTWLEFFLRLIIHQAIFPSTAYTVTGFTESLGQLCVIVEQPWFDVKRGAPEEETDAFLSQIGFVNLEYNEFYNQEHGIVLDDLHDENVLMGYENNLVVVDPIIYLEIPEMCLRGNSLFRFPYEKSFQ